MPLRTYTFVTPVAALLLLLILLYDKYTHSLPSRLHTDQGPKSGFGLLPAVPNNAPLRARGVDIIFIHGLGSNPDTTWAAKTSESSVNWVTDFLPDDLPPGLRQDTRLFFYNYDSYWVKDAVDTRLSILANELLEHISTEINQNEQEQERSIFFIAHSYGGLVVKQALVQASTTRRYNPIASRIKSTIFLGTPHYGSSLSDWGQWWAKILSPIGSNPSLIAEAGYRSDYLRDLHQQFVEFFHDGHAITNFFEQRPIHIFKFRSFSWSAICVDEYSATFQMPGISNIGLPVNHYALNKFATRTETYRRIKSKIVDNLQQNLKPTVGHYLVPVGTVPTYVDRPALIKELEDKFIVAHQNAHVPHTVLITGLGGSGKSQLALAFAERYKYHFNQILYIDATDSESLSDSFERCAVGLGIISPDGAPDISSLGVASEVLKWLRKRKPEDGKWLAILDNADDLTWDLKKFIPKGSQGSIIVTSQDQKFPILAKGTYESLLVGDLTLDECLFLLRLNSLRLGLDDSFKNLVEKGYFMRMIDVGCLPLAADFGDKLSSSDHDILETHLDQLFWVKNSGELLPVEKSVWSAWESILDKLDYEYPHLMPSEFLRLVARLECTVFEHPMSVLCPTSPWTLELGSIWVYYQTGEDGCPLTDGRLQCTTRTGRWDDISYQQTRDLLVRYGLLNKTDCPWPGVTMHGLVRWRFWRDLGDNGQHGNFPSCVWLTTAGQHSHGSDSQDYAPAVFGLAARDRSSSKENYKPRELGAIVSACSNVAMMSDGMFYATIILAAIDILEEHTNANQPSSFIFWLTIWDALWYISVSKDERDIFMGVALRAIEFMVGLRLSSLQYFPFPSLLVLMMRLLTMLVVQFRVVLYLWNVELPPVFLYVYVMQGLLSVCHTLYIAKIGEATFHNVMVYLSLHGLIHSLASVWVDVYLESSIE